jgi:uncharacterized SAM-binding protein YcdF (DUF218 family)
MTSEIHNAAITLWNYHHMNHQIMPADCIMALGSHDLRVAEEAARLYLKGLAPIIVFSGGLGNLTSKIWTETEADKFAGIAKNMGVPESAILIENESTNTGENVLFTEELFSAAGLNPQSMILVQKPYMERRTYATAKIYWQDKNLMVTSPQIDFDDYPNEEIPRERVISIMVGDLERIKYYYEKGFQIYQEIPDDVWSAWELLVEADYNGHRMPA